MNGNRIIVSDTGPLISLEKLSDSYTFIRNLYDTILIPPAVRDELYWGQFVSWRSYCDHYDLQDFIKVVEPVQQVAFPGADILDEGERQAIQLSLEQALPLLIEEEFGRTIAVELGLQISGIAGQALKAFRSGLLERDDAMAKLEELIAAGRINTRVFEAVVEAVKGKA